MRRTLLIGALALVAASPAAATVSWNIGTAAGDKVVQNAYVGEAGTNHKVLNGYIGTAAGNKQFYSSAPTVSASPGSISQTASSISYTFSPNTSAVVSGGSGSYSYSWTVTGTDGGGETWSIPSGSTTANPVVAISGAAVHSSYSATIACTVTDSVYGGSASTGDVPYSYTRP